MSQVLFAEPTDQKAIRAYMRRRPRPDAFVCQNDALAADFACSLRQLGYSIPEDVMIAGFDGMDISRVMTPPTTTIRQPYAEIARAVFEQLMRRVRNPAGPAQRIYLPEKLIVRASTQRERKGVRHEGPPICLAVRASARRHLWPRAGNAVASCAFCRCARRLAG